MTEAEATVGESRRISSIWLVPIIALVLGIGMVVHTLQSQGPEITIVFASGESIEAGKTKIKFRNVEIGLVESVGLGDEFDKVVVTAQIDKAAASLLREDSDFWVVRPRVGPGGVSGLGTLLSGGYIEIAPGVGKSGRHEFVGLEVPPLTAAGAPGLHFEMFSAEAGSIGAGDPILYKGFRVGKIDSAEFRVEDQKMRYGAFIAAPYDVLVTSTTRFWNGSGIEVTANAEGIDIRTASIEEVLVGGVVFGVPDGMKAGEPVGDGEVFELYENLAAVNARPYRTAIDYVVQFPQSVRGLRPGAPVEYRGIPMGRVGEVMLAEMTRQGLARKGAPIPVLIHIEPGRLGAPDTEEGAALFRNSIAEAVANGLRATLSTGNLLTGSLYVNFDIYPSAPQAELGTFADRPTIPTIASGLGGIQASVGALLDKLNELPLDDTVAGVDRFLDKLNALPLETTLDNVDGLLAGVNRLVEGEGVQALPAALELTLAELRETLDSISTDSEMQDRLLRTVTEFDRTLESLRGLMDALERKPNAIIFNHQLGNDPQPPAGSP